MAYHASEDLKRVWIYQKLYLHMTVWSRTWASKPAPDSYQMVDWHFRPFEYQVFQQNFWKS